MRVGYAIATERVVEAAAVAVESSAVWVRSARPTPSWLVVRVLSESAPALVASPVSTRAAPCSHRPPVASAVKVPPLVPPPLPWVTHVSALPGVAVTASKVTR